MRCVNLQGTSSTLIWQIHKAAQILSLIHIWTPTATTTPELDYSFRRKFGVEIEAYNCTCQRLVRELTAVSYTHLDVYKRQTDFFVYYSAKLLTFCKNSYLFAFAHIVSYESF